MKTLGIFIGSTRKVSNTVGIASWVQHLINQQIPNTFKVKVFTPTQPYDLISIPINSISPLVIKQSESYDDPVIQKWSKEMYNTDAFIFINPVYNHSYPGGFKIAMDHLYHEFSGKPLIIISQGPVAPAKASDAVEALAQKIGMKVIDIINISTPKEFIMGTTRIPSVFDPEVHKFLQPLDNQLISDLKKI